MDFEFTAPDTQKKEMIRRRNAAYSRVHYERNKDAINKRKRMRRAERAVDRAMAALDLNDAAEMRDDAA